MKQHPIDLIPQTIRVQSQAGVRTGRYVASVTTAVLLIVVAATHTRISLNRARAEFTQARDQADLVLSTEEKANDLREQLNASNEYIDRYQKIAMPLEVSSVIAAAISAIPPGLTLDRLDLDAGARRIMRSPRSKGAINPDQRLPRVLTGELSGFAPDDESIAEYIAVLEQIEPLRNVSLDYSRTRSVRERPAREFRLSFRVDLDVPYEVIEQVDPALDVSAHAQEVPDGQRPQARAQGDRRRRGAGAARRGRAGVAGVP